MAYTIRDNETGEEKGSYPTLKKAVLHLEIITGYTIKKVK